MTEQYKNPESASERNKKIISKLTRFAIVAALSGVIVAGATGCTDRAEASDPFTKFDPTIESITISPDANIRSEPNVPNRYDPNNIITTTEDTLTVHINGGTKIRDDGVNGEFYRIPVEDIKFAKHSQDVKSDSDGYVWVNEQRATANRD